MRRVDHEPRSSLEARRLFLPEASPPGKSWGKWNMKPSLATWSSLSYLLSSFFFYNRSLVTWSTPWLPPVLVFYNRLLASPCPAPYVLENQVSRHVYVAIRKPVGLKNASGMAVGSRPHAAEFVWELWRVSINNHVDWRGMEWRVE